MSSQRASGKGDFQRYAERRLEILANFKKRRQTQRFQNNFESGSNQYCGSALLRSTSSMYREPVSHTKGAFKHAIMVIYLINNLFHSVEDYKVTMFPYSTLKISMWTTTINYSGNPAPKETIHLTVECLCMPWTTNLRGSGKNFKF